MQILRRKVVVPQAHIITSPRDTFSAWLSNTLLSKTQVPSYLCINSLIYSKDIIREILPSCISQRYHIPRGCLEGIVELKFKVSELLESLNMLSTPVGAYSTT